MAENSSFANVYIFAITRGAFHNDWDATIYTGKSDVGPSKPHSSDPYHDSSLRD